MERSMDKIQRSTQTIWLKISTDVLGKDGSFRMKPEQVEREIWIRYGKRDVNVNPKRTEQLQIGIEAVRKNQEGKK